MTDGSAKAMNQDDGLSGTLDGVANAVALPGPSLLVNACGSGKLGGHREKSTVTLNILTKQLFLS
jgi:hypothetical protein